MSLYWFCFSLCLSDEFLGIVLLNLAFPSLTFSYLLALIFVVMDSYDALEDRDNVTFSDRVFVGFGLVRPVEYTFYLYTAPFRTCRVYSLDLIRRVSPQSRHPDYKGPVIFV